MLTSKKIARHLAKESGSLTVAARWLEAAFARCHLHASHPEMGELCLELGKHVRRFSLGNYVVYFERAREGITLLRVLHAHRDLPSAWHEGSTD